jgi:hypothetical protein
MKVLNEPVKRECWMCGTDADYEVGFALGGSTVYPDEEDLKERLCIGDKPGDCCARRVYIIIDADEYDKWITEIRSKVEELEGIVHYKETISCAGKFGDAFNKQLMETKKANDCNFSEEFGTPIVDSENPFLHPDDVAFEPKGVIMAEIPAKEEDENHLNDFEKGGEG